MKNYILPVFLLSIIVFSPLLAQDLDEEIGFQYVKGNYLFDSGRYDEAIQVYNAIVKEDPSFKEVLIYRGNAKYHLGAYRGAKKDAIQYLELKGLNAAVSLLLGKSEIGLNNPENALNYLDVVCLWDEENEDAFLNRANVLNALDDTENACADWYRAMKLGSDLARQRFSINCDDMVFEEPEEEIYDEEPEEEVLSMGERLEEELDEKMDREPVQKENMDEEAEVIQASDLKVLTPEKKRMEDEEELDEIAKEEADEEVEEPIRKVRILEPVDETVETIEIDEDLDIRIYGGVGNRAVKEIPEILILSDNSGEVVINICIDQSGNVVKASLNRDLSTVGSAGLISLALRKSREFKFDRNRKKEQCGKLAFVLK